MEYRRMRSVGSSHYIILPKKWLKELHISAKDWLRLYFFKDRIEIRKGGEE